VFHSYVKDCDAASAAGKPWRRPRLRTCFGPLRVAYDYDAIKRVLTRELIESRPRNLWRYR
jgi:threonine synthase